MLLTEENKENHISIFTYAKSVVLVLKNKNNVELVDLKSCTQWTEPEIKKSCYTVDPISLQHTWK